MRHTRYMGERAKDLTRRETQILEIVKKGLQSKDISLELGITEKTVKFHLTNIYRKLGICGRRDLNIDVVNYRRVPHEFKKVHANTYSFCVLPRGVK